MDPNYAHLAAAYDDLFPVDPDAVSFLEISLGGFAGRRIVDAGCGSGSLARTLADRGATVYGFDLDEALLKRALERQAGTSRLHFARADLAQWTLPSGWPQVDAVVSLGNTLPHLTTESELEAFFQRTAKNLCPRGRLIVQVLDYEHLERNHILELPQRTVGPWTFTRRCEVRSDGLWTFHTQLDGPLGRGSQAFPLRPWNQATLRRLLAAAGFVVTGVFGGFDRSAPGSSLPLVLEAHTA